MKVINLFGAPGTGKSATMLGLGNRLKRMGLSAEITPEYFKELIQEVTPEAYKEVMRQDSARMRFGGQLQVLAEQNRRLAMHVNSTDFVVSDCPLPLVAFYTSKDYIPGFHEMANNLFNKYDNVNYLVVPSPTQRHDFENANRVHDAQQSALIQQNLQQFLAEHRVSYQVVEADDQIEDVILRNMRASGALTTKHLQESRNPEVRRSASLAWGAP